MTVISIDSANNEIWISGIVKDVSKGEYGIILKLRADKKNPLHETEISLIGLERHKEKLIKLLKGE